MRRAKRPRARSGPAPSRQQTRHRVHRRHLQRLVEGQRRQDAGHAAAPSSSCRRPAGRRAGGCGRRPRRSRARAARAAGRARRPGRAPRAPRAALARGRLRRRRTRPGSLSARTASASDATGKTSRPATIAASLAFDAGSRMPVTPSRLRRGGDRQHAARRMNRSVERQLAEQHEVGDVPPLDDALRREDAERDRQVERRARLPHVGRRQVDRDAMRRKLEARVPDGAPHAVAALAHARVGQPDHRERGEAERDIDLDLDRAGVHAEHGGRAEAGEHAPRAANRASGNDRQRSQRVSGDLAARRPNFRELFAGSGT